MKWQTRKNGYGSIHQMFVLAMVVCIMCAVFFGITLGTRAGNMPCTPRQELSTTGFPTKEAADHWIDNLTSH